MPAYGSLAAEFEVLHVSAHALIQQCMSLALLTERRLETIEHEGLRSPSSRSSSGGGGSSGRSSGAGSSSGGGSNGGGSSGGGSNGGGSSGRGGSSSNRGDVGGGSSSGKGSGGGRRSSTGDDEQYTDVVRYKVEGWVAAKQQVNKARSACFIMQGCLELFDGFAVLGSQLEAVGAALCAKLPLPWLCNNP
jgi:hypothetical protein